jgi:tryptophan halogenase
VVAFGLASGFLEPLESTSIHLVQVAIAKLLALFPKNGIVMPVVDQFNSEMLEEYENVKDFLIAHYHITEREDTPFWKYCKNMDIPDSLKARLEIFRSTGTAAVKLRELFKETSWFAVLVGQGLLPKDYHPLADVISEDELRLRMSKINTGIQGRVKGLGTHDDFIIKHCATPMMEKPMAKALNA